MGNIINSGYFKDMYEEANTCADHSIATRPRTPMPTPKHIRMLSADPRSPTDYISRTPIEVTSYSRLPEPIISTLNDLDPRSPSLGIDRTPIQVLLNAATFQEDCLEHETKSYLETNFDFEEECDVADMMNDLDLVSTSPSVDYEPLTLPAPIADTQSLIADLPSTPSLLSAGKEDSIQINMKVKKPVHVAETTPSRKRNRSQNKENGIGKMQLIKSDKLPTPTKVRTPLGTVSSHHNSPLQIVRGKQCRIINQMPPNSGEVRKSAAN